MHVFRIIRLTIGAVAVAAAPLARAEVHIDPPASKDEVEAPSTTTTTVPTAGVATAPGTVAAPAPDALTQTMRAQTLTYTLANQAYAVSQQTQLMGVSFLYLQSLGGWVQGETTGETNTGDLVYKSKTPQRVLKSPTIEREWDENEAKAYYKTKGADCPPGEKLSKIAEDIQNGVPVKAKSPSGANGKIDPACHKVVKPDGTYGPWGDHLYRELTPARAPALFKKNLSDMGSLCPRFTSMGEEEKRQFWIWVFMAMAQRESSCRERITAQGTNGIAAGVLQLHLGSEGNYGCPARTRALVATESFSCGVRMLDRYVSKNGRLFTRPGTTYWQVLHDNASDGDRTRAIIRTYGGCR